MTDVFAKVNPGQKVRIAAATFNAMVDAARDYRDRALQQTRTPATAGSRSTGLIRVKNYANVDRSRFSVQTINGVTFDPTVDLNQYQNDPLPTFHAPAVGESRLLAILQEPIPAHGVGMAIVNGCTVAQVNVIATTDQYADITAGNVDYLTSGASGPFAILSALAATGQQWVFGKIGGGAPAASGAAPFPAKVISSGGGAVYTVLEQTYGSGGYATLSGASNFTAINLAEIGSGPGAAVTLNSIVLVSTLASRSFSVPAGQYVFDRAVYAKYLD